MSEDKVRNEILLSELGMLEESFPIPQVQKRHCTPSNLHSKGDKDARRNFRNFAHMLPKTTKTADGHSNVDVFNLTQGT